MVSVVAWPNGWFQRVRVTSSYSPAAVLSMALNASGANIVVRRCNVADRADVDTLLFTGLEGLPPVRGIIHGAMVLHVSLALPNPQHPTDNHRTSSSRR